jgi:hypothetical protein
VTFVDDLACKSRLSVDSEFQKVGCVLSAVGVASAEKSSPACWWLVCRMSFFLLAKFCCACRAGVSKRLDVYVLLFLSYLEYT